MPLGESMLKNSHGAASEDSGPMPSRQRGLQRVLCNFVPLFGMC